MRSNQSASRKGTVQKIIFTPGLRSPGVGTPVTSGRLLAGGLVIPGVSGRSGTAWRKREGDGTSPRGIFRITAGYFRSDRIKRPFARIDFRAIRPSDGWCDDPASANYNRPVRLPFRPRHETLWREDQLYDLVLVLDYNISPRVRARGSAIFFHLWRTKGSPTAGCIAININWMRKLLPRLSRAATVEIR